VSSGGARAGEGAPGSRATGATAVVSVGSEEAGTGTGDEAGGEPTQSSGWQPEKELRPRKST